MTTLPLQTRFALSSGQISQMAVLTTTAMVLLVRAGSEGGWLESAWCRNLGATPQVKLNLYIKQGTGFIPWRSVDINSDVAQANTRVAPVYLPIAEYALEPNQEIWASLSAPVTDGVTLAIQGNYLGRSPLYDAAGAIGSTSRRATSNSTVAFSEPMISTSRRANSESTVYLGRVANADSDGRRAKSESVAGTGRITNLSSTSRRATSESDVEVQVTGAIASNSRRATSESDVEVQVTGAIASTSRRAQSSLIEATNIDVTSTSRRATSESEVGLGRVIDMVFTSRRARSDGGVTTGRTGDISSTSRRATSESIVLLQRAVDIGSTSRRANSDAIATTGRQTSISSTSRRANSDAIATTGRQTSISSTSRRANSSGTLSSNDPDATIYFNAVTAAGGTLSSTEQTAIDAFISGLKTDGLWTALQRGYLFAGAWSSSHVAFKGSNAIYLNLASGNYNSRGLSGTTYGGGGRINTEYIYSIPLELSYIAWISNAATDTNTGYNPPPTLIGTSWIANEHRNHAAIIRLYDVGLGYHFNARNGVASFVNPTGFVGYTCSNSNSIARGYIGGSEVGSSTNTSTWNDPGSTQGSVKILDNCDYRLGFAGVWSVALTQTQIANLRTRLTTLMGAMGRSV